MRHLFILAISILAIFSSLPEAKAQDSPDIPYKVMIDRSELYDQSRERLIPIAVYYPKKIKAHNGEKVIMLSHGYGANQGGDYMKYSYLGNYLASMGYVVISIQHELPTDSLIPDGGIPQVVRRPNWERGVRNIQFVLKQVKLMYPKLDYKHVTLMGHSNGGDMSMLFCSKYPEQVWKVISLDNRRMALPRTSHPRVYSLRSSDQPADEGVLPTADEQKKYKMKIVKLPNTIHNAMDDKATGPQRQEINNYVLGFLKEN